MDFEASRVHLSFNLLFAEMYGKIISAVPEGDSSSSVKLMEMWDY